MRIKQHLLDLGHRDFAVIASFTSRNDRARERLAGVREALAGRGIDLQPTRIVETDFSVPQGRRAFLQLRERAAGFTALVCSNDLLALGALSECLRRGLRVRDELSIAGFDAIDMAAEVTPALAATSAMPPYVAEEYRPGAAVQSDDELLDFARGYGATIFHPAGTCKMGSDPQAVVDERLRVHGVGGLRVVDCSIMPRLVAGNTAAPVVMIAEKASHMILEEARG